MPHIDDIQAEIDAKHRLLAHEQTTRKMWAVLALTHLIAMFIPWIATVFLGIGLLMWMLGYSESIRLVREISKLARRRKTLEEQVEGFIQDRGEAIRQRMASMLAAEARERARRSGSREMFKGNCIDVKP